MYYFIGIKGAGMSALAIMLNELGYEVSGSDVDKHFFTEEGLVKNNIPFYVYDESNIKEGMKIIKGESITEDNVELIEARKMNLEILSYHEMLGILTNRFKTICVAGCHGKTTTTAMISHMLSNITGVNYLIGDGTGSANSNSDIFVLESCEYRRHFLSYKPYYAIITNIDLDHVDYYRDINDIIEAYQDFANNTSHMIIAYGDDKYTRKMKINKPIKFYGIQNNNDIKATNIEYTSNGTKFDVIVDNELFGSFDLPIYGEHQLLDILSAISIGYYEKIEADLLQKELSTFKGARRRFTESAVGNNIIIDDYAHHPNEVRATLNAIKQKYPNKKIIAVFQPHTFSRTKEIAKDMCEVLSKVDKSYILDIHPAREKQEDYPDITSNIISDNLNNSSPIKMDEYEKLLEKDDSVYIFMSPNDLSKLENGLKELLTK